MRGLIHAICTYAGWEIKVLNRTVQVIVLGFIFVVSWTPLNKCLSPLHAVKTRLLNWATRDGFVGQQTSTLPRNGRRRGDIPKTLKLCWICCGMVYSFGNIAEMNIHITHRYQVCWWTGEMIFFVMRTRHLKGEPFFHKNPAYAIYILKFVLFVFTNWRKMNESSFWHVSHYGFIAG